MKLLRVQIISAETCGGLLDEFNLTLRNAFGKTSLFDPLCIIGPNGAGKSQFLQILAEIFQSIFHACLPSEERAESNPDLQFEIEYIVYQENEEDSIHVRISRKSSGRQRPNLSIQRWDEDEYDWIDCGLQETKTQCLLPKKIVGYTSGDNETLSLPFLISRSGYADEVGRRALDNARSSQYIPDTRLMLIDYGTHLEVLVANLLLGRNDQINTLLEKANLRNLHSFRCIIQLAHSAAPRARKEIRERTGRKGIQLTEELEQYVDRLKRCATCFTYDEETETYTLDYLVNDQTRIAFNSFWSSAFDLYASFHKLSMLNDLVLPRKTRIRFQKDARTRRFAARLPEPQDENKVFRFERVSFHSRKNDEVVDYVSLSDGEHQLGQLLGIFCMLAFPNILFILDEAESHFNPKWRVQFISQILDLPTDNGNRREKSISAKQDCLITTHAPFIPSDMQRDKVFIFSKDDKDKIQARNPSIETFGATFDKIIEECFNVRPPISQISRDEIEELMKSKNPEEIRTGLKSLGDSIEKVYLADHLRELTSGDGV
jgi:restriction system-associated AAA family ATPase